MTGMALLELSRSRERGNCMILANLWILVIFLSLCFDD